MHHMNVDIETFSSVDIGKSGLYKYAQSPDFQILLFAYSIDGAPVEVMDLTQGVGLPPEIVAALQDPNIIKHAYNAAFEWYCLSQLWKTPLEQWRCTQLHGLYCGYTAGLAATGAALGLPVDKRKLATGKALIKLFCVPCAPTARNGHRTRNMPWHEPEKWQLFIDYNRQDVVTEMEIERRLSAFPVPEKIQREWEIDQQINARGVAVDLDLIEGALWCSEAVTVEHTQEAQALTSLENPNSPSQLLGWLEQQGCPMEDLKKDTVANALQQEPPDNVRRVLELRQEMSKTSVKKYAAMQVAACRNGRVKGLLQFYGANRTGRWAGRIIQPQNLPRTYIETTEAARELVKSRNVEAVRMIYGSVSDTLSQLIRTALVPAPGRVFIDADFSAIEARVIAWLAGEQWRLDVFNSHGKIYEASASQMFGVPIEKIKKGNPEYALRQKGKVAELALGYQGASGALIAMGALNMGLTEEELPDIVSRWRASNRRIVDLWYKLQAAVIECIRSGHPTAVNGLVFAVEADVQNDLDFLTIALPSGRKLYYAHPSLGQNRWGGDSIQYYGVDQQTRKWIQLETYGGKLVENVVQAIARDCLAESINRLEAAGFPVVFHVHDEVVIEAPHTDNDTATLEAVCNIMGQPISWAPGLPLKADGWVGNFYTKD